MLILDPNDLENIDKALKKYKKKFEKSKLLLQLREKDQLKGIQKMPGKKGLLKPNSLSLVFNSSDFNVEEITDVLNLFASLYHELSGDNLIIKGMSSFSMAPVPKEVPA